nr:retrovirus-related Pol polyprotein from transposon 17.6 [Tanacetum cinerariifolium]
MDLKTQLETVAKNHQASIQNLETKFDRLADKQSGRPSGSLPSNIQPNPKGHNSKTYQPPQARNEHINALFTRSGKSYYPPVNPNDQQDKSKTPINFDSDNEDDETTPQPKIRNAKPVKETPIRTERMIFNIDSKMKHSHSNDDTCFNIDVIDEILEEDFDALLDEGCIILHSIEGTCLGKEILAEFDEFIEMTADENSDSESDTKEPPFEKITINTDYKIKTSLEEPPTDLELKPLPDNLECVFLEEPTFLPLLEDKKPVVQKQRRLNSNMQEVVKKEIVKLLDTGIIYLISDSLWVSLIHCVQKKEVLQSSPTKMMNLSQQEPSQVGEYASIIVNSMKQPQKIIVLYNLWIKLKTTFTCPSGTYAFRRMPFGLCNVTATFQRCMLAIFHDMIEESFEVFMENFSVFGNSFKTCLNNLDKMLQRCNDAHLVLNWEKCHFMVKERIVLGHKVSSAELEVDKAKIDVISKLPPPANIKEIKDKKGTKNAAADHLSRIKNNELSDESEVDDNFLEETLMEINTKDEPWFADFANYLVSDSIPKGMTYQQKNNFFSDLKHYFWEDPYLFKVCSDGMIRRCISGPETRTILDQCHHGPIGGHYGPNVTAKKVLDSGFYWPTIIKEAHTLVRLCEACQNTGNIPKCNEMPLNTIQV